MSDAAPSANLRTYADTMRETQLARDEAAIKRNIEAKLKQEAEEKKGEDGAGKKRGRWDSETAAESYSNEKPSKKSKWDQSPPKSSISSSSSSTTVGSWDET